LEAWRSELIELEHEPQMEDAACVWHHLFRLGIHVYFYPHRSTRGSATAVCGDTVLHGRAPAVGVDVCAAGAVADSAGVGLDQPACCVDLRVRLRVTVLGRAEGCVRRCGCDHGHDSGVHCHCGDCAAADAADDAEAWWCAGDWTRRCRSVDGSLV